MTKREHQTESHMVLLAGGNKFDAEQSANNGLLGNPEINPGATSPRNDNNGETDHYYARKFRNWLSPPRVLPERGVSLRKGVVSKNGDCNISHYNVSTRGKLYLADIFTTLLDIQWRYNLIIFSMAFICSWLGFAVLWWLVSLVHGDFDHIDDRTWKPCVQNLYSFTLAFTFSVETQITIGYGYIYVTEECPEAIFIMCLQSVTGILIQAFMVGVVFAKLSRPKKRTQTLLFSHNALIAQRDGKLCLTFRIADMRKSHIIQARVHAHIVKKRVTLEGEIHSHHLHEFKVRFDTCNDHLFFIWPCTLVHVIDETSPFYYVSAQELLRENFEMVVILEGCIESTGMSTQARSSYLPSEILWGYRFAELMTYRKETGRYGVDYSHFNSTYAVETPQCSAYELEEMKNSGRHLKKRHSTGSHYKRRFSRASS